MPYFDHERLDVYQAAVDFTLLADSIVRELPRGRSYLADQLQRAASSIPLNIAEGTGEFSKPDKARFYRMARRSATECAAILDICRRRGLCRNEVSEQARAALLRIVAMLVRMVQRAAGESEDHGPDRSRRATIA